MEYFLIGFFALCVAWSIWFMIDPLDGDHYAD
jgi:hypothetical protein